MNQKPVYVARMMPDAQAEYDAQKLTSTNRTRELAWKFQVSALGLSHPSMQEAHPAPLYLRMANAIHQNGDLRADVRNLL